MSSTLQGSGSYLRGLLGANTWLRGASLTQSTCLVHMLRPSPEFAEEPLDAEALVIAQLVSRGSRLTSQEVRLKIHMARANDVR